MMAGDVTNRRKFKVPNLPRHIGENIPLYLYTQDRNGVDRLS